MAGHSHWAGIKYKKAVIDNKRGKLWSKLSKAIIVAARMGGGDVDMNLRLRYAIADARAVSMPKENIERAVKRGTGELDGGNVDEVVYEGYGPGGVAVMCDIFTDNRNRTAPEVRKIFDVNGGKLGAAGCVAWMFDRKGLFLIPADKIAENDLMEIVLETGADDVKLVGTIFEVTCSPEFLTQLSDTLDRKSVAVESKQLTRIPQNTIELDLETARSVLKLLDELDEHDDVQTVSANYSIPDDALAQLSAAT